MYFLRAAVVFSVVHVTTGQDTFNNAFTKTKANKFQTDTVQNNEEDEFFWLFNSEASLSFTPPPTLPPTPPPTPPPTLPPTPPPSPAPTGPCDIDLKFECVGQPGSGFEGVPCTEIPGEQQLTCTCPFCVREVQFQYTGDRCDPTVPAQCEDTPGPSNLANIIECINPTTGNILVETAVSPGDLVTIGDPGSSCLPEAMECRVFSLADA